MVPPLPHCIIPWRSTQIGTYFHSVRVSLIRSRPASSVFWVAFGGLKGLSLFPGRGSADAWLILAGSMDAPGAPHRFTGGHNEVH